MSSRHDVVPLSDALKHSALATERDRPFTNIPRDLIANADSTIGRYSRRIDARTVTLRSRIGGYHWCFALCAGGRDTGFETRKSRNLCADVERKMNRHCLDTVGLSTFREIERLYVAHWSCSGQAEEGGRRDKDLY